MSPDAFMKLYETRLRLQRFEEVAPLISEDADFWFTDGSHHGLRQIGAAFEKTWQTLPNETYWFEDMVWIATSDTAASCIYRFCWTAEADGRSFHGTGRGTTVLAKREGRLENHSRTSQPFPRLGYPRAAAFPGGNPGRMASARITRSFEPRAKCMAALQQNVLA